MSNLKKVSIANKMLGTCDVCHNRVSSRGSRRDKFFSVLVANEFINVYVDKVVYRVCSCECAIICERGQ